MGLKEEAQALRLSRWSLVVYQTPPSMPPFIPSAAVCTEALGRHSGAHPIHILQYVFMMSNTTTSLLPL